jgi:hypothetical protein
MTPDPQKTPKKDFIVKQGATFIRVIKFRDQATGELQSLDGLVSASLFARPDDNTDPIELSTDGTDPAILIDTVNKKITITITDEITDTYQWTSASYRFEVTDAAGEVFRRLVGRLKLEKKVT